jgi:hypothetical protein
MKSWLFLALAGIASAATAQVAEPTLEDWLIERQEWTWEVEANASITVENAWGNIAVRAHALPEVYLLANSQRHREDPRALRLGVSKDPEDFSVVVEFDEKDIGEGSPLWAKRRADITVFVPETAATRFSTDNGDLEIRGTRGATEARSSSGNISLRIRGDVIAETDHGNVLVQFIRTDWSRPVAITTLTGEIRIEMPLGGRAEVAIETRGEITSDYSMVVERAEGSQLKRVRASVGDEGGVELRLTSNRGAIKLLESLRPEETDGR